jgi:hypothetical protein
MEYSHYLADERLWIEGYLQYVKNEKAYGYNSPSGFTSYPNTSSPIWLEPRIKGKHWHSCCQA